MTRFLHFERAGQYGSRHLQPKSSCGEEYPTALATLSSPIDILEGRDGLCFFRIFLKEGFKMHLCLVEFLQLMQVCSRDHPNGLAQVVFPDALHVGFIEFDQGEPQAEFLRESEKFFPCFLVRRASRKDTAVGPEGAMPSFSWSRTASRAPRAGEPVRPFGAM